ncbi:MAG: HAMP domain-containing histidine kinase [Bacteroidia bacterium]|nr:HAMP domain-containing histidine kinase [Bacteroidia bacterium]
MKLSWGDWKNKILNVGVEPDTSDFIREQVRNANQSSVLSFIYSLVSTCFVAIIVPPPYIYIPLAGSFLYLAGLWLSYIKKRDLAGMSSWFISLLLFFWLANAYGKSSNAYLLFIIAEILAIFNFMIYDYRWRIFQLILPVVFSVISYITHFSLFLIPTITEVERSYIDPIMFFCVLFSCGNVVWIYGNHIINHNKEVAQAQAELEQKYTELQVAHADLRNANEELDRFVYSVSHDLRAPITSVMGLLDLCESDKENLDKYLALQKKSMLKLDTFIADILHYSRNARMSLSPVAINLETIIREAYDAQCFAHQAENMEFEITIKGKGTIYTDEFRLNIIISNLISNAIRYRNVKATPSFIHFEIENQPGLVSILIKDNGIGIAKEQLPRVFEMFYRGSSRTSGSGLGLYIVQEALKKINGTISVTSEINVGTHILLKIPDMNRSEIKE